MSEAEGFDKRRVDEFFAELKAAVGSEEAAKNPKKRRWWRRLVEARRARVDEIWRRHEAEVQAIRDRLEGSLGPESAAETWALIEKRQRRDHSIEVVAALVGFPLSFACLFWLAEWGLVSAAIASIAIGAVWAVTALHVYSWLALKIAEGNLAGAADNRSWVSVYRDRLTLWRESFSKGWRSPEPPPWLRRWEAQLDRVYKPFPAALIRMAAGGIPLGLSAICAAKAYHSRLADFDIVVWGGGALVWLAITVLVAVKKIGSGSYIRGLELFALSVGLVVGFCAAGAFVFDVILAVEGEARSSPQEFLILATLAATGYLSLLGLEKMEAKP